MNLQNDFELHPKFAKSYQEFWLQKEVAIQYPALWEKVKILLIAFPTSYLVEKGFSSVSQLLGKQRLWLDIVNHGDLRLNLTNIQPDLEKIVSHHQVHPAHGKPAKAKEVVFKNFVTSKDIQRISICYHCMFVVLRGSTGGILILALALKLIAGFWSFVYG